MCEWFDNSCGQLLDYVEAKGVADNTVVIYICDNGWAATSTNARDANQKSWKGYALRSKGSPYENGIRTPIMISWPKKLAPQRSQDFAHAIDLFPTIAGATGLEAPTTLPGVNLLDKKKRNARKTIFGVTHAIYNMTPGNPDDTQHYLWCVDGDWKLILRYDARDTTHYQKVHEWDTARQRLYNLNVDPAENHDRASEFPKVVARLTAKIHAWH
jgi:arylsulfatase A-like enzyme